MDFLNSINWQFVVELAAILLALIGGIGAVQIINWIKELLKLSSRWTQLLTATVAVLIAILTAVVAGTIAPEPLTDGALTALFLSVLTSSQAEYQRIKSKQESDPADHIG